MKSKRKIRDPRFAIVGIMYTIVSNSTFKFFEAFIYKVRVRNKNNITNLKILTILNPLKSPAIVYKLEVEATYLTITPASVPITIIRSNMFHEELK